MAVPFPDTAIIAIIAAPVGYLNQPTDENTIAKTGKRNLPRLLLQIIQGIRVLAQQ